jgi:hypothetical protein
MNLVTRYDYAMFLSILTEAEDRVQQFAVIAPDVARRSSETVALCEQRMATEGLTRNELARRAGVRR